MLSKPAPTREEVESWFKRDPSESVDSFITYLDGLDHDYGTIVEALAAVAIHAARKMNHAEKSGGIIGFQASGVMWTFVQRWLHQDGPMKLMKFENMLFPQYRDEFEKTISKDTWKYLQKEAAGRLGSRVDVSTKVKAHWISIASGTVPFGYTVRNEE